MSVLIGIAAAAILTVLDLEAFGFGLGGAVGLLHLFGTPGLGLVLLACGMKSGRPGVRRLGLVLILATIVSFVVARMLHSRQLAASKAVGDVLCEALESFRQATGRYPERLQDLTPAFLADVPSSKMGVWSSLPFDYQPDPQGGDYHFGFHSTFFTYCARTKVASWRCDD